MRKNITAMTLCLALACTLAYQAHAQTGVLSVKAVVDLIESGLQSIENMTASYVIENDGYRNAGTFFYKRPFSIRLNSTTDASQIVSNGRLLWIFLPHIGIVAEQDLVRNDNEFNQLLSRSRKNFDQLKRDYSFKFADGGRNDPQSYILDLEPRVSKIGFRSIRLWVNRDSGIITRISARTVNNKPVSITFTNINTATELSSGIFWFGMPDSNVQVIRNTILPVDLFDRARR